MFFISILLSVLLNPTSAVAGDEGWSVRLIEDRNEALPSPPQGNLCRTSKSRTWAEVITVGKQVWDIVKDGKPSLNFESESAAVIPTNANCALDLTDWSLPRIRTYELIYTNILGIDVVTFIYKVIYTYGGKFNDRGAYLANVAIHPGDIEVAWGQTFDASVRVSPAVNLGTKQNPVAGLEISLEWSLENVLQTFRSKRVYFIDGTGTLTEM